MSTPPLHPIHLVVFQVLLLTIVVQLLVIALILVDIRSAVQP